MTSWKAGELQTSSPEPHVGIIPTPGGGETRITTLVDVRLCASLLIVVILVVAVIFLMPANLPAPTGISGVWALVPPAAVSLLALSRRSYLRILRFRRG
ncbi:hypothetical protein [Streptomyces sp. NPDC057623]|uniref:hypothetical protein n=1 Tax=Streptomyces sp. NPDC057623 TaxID=3346187 RepID=UPI003674A06D